MSDWVDVFFAIGKRSRIVRLFVNRDSIECVLWFRV
jgi:hypothetical protein